MAAGLVLLWYVASACSEGTGFEAEHSSEPPGTAIETILTIGGLAEAPAPYLFENITEAYIAPDGRIVVLERGSRQIRIYDHAGNHIRSFGGMGAGPLEFMELTGSWMKHDTVAIWDVGLQRVSEWTLEGEQVASRRLPLNIMPLILGSLRDGAWLGVRPAEHRPMRPGEINDAPASLLRITGDSPAPDVLARIPWEPMAAGISPTNPDGSMYIPQPFGRSSRIGVADSVYYLSDGSVIRVFSPSGELIDSLSLPSSTDIRRVTPEDRTKWLESTLNGTQPELRPVVRRFMNSVTLPEQYPAIDGLSPADDDILWIRLFAPPFESTGESWIRLDRRSGRHRLVVLPTGFRATHFRGSRVVGTERDDVGLLSVTVLQLLRP